MVIRDMKRNWDYVQLIVQIRNRKSTPETDRSSDDIVTVDRSFKRDLNRHLSPTHLVKIPTSLTPGLTLSVQSSSSFSVLM